MKDPNHEILIIDMSSVTMIDLSGAYALEDFINNIKNKNIKVYVTNAKASIKKILEQVDFIKHIGEDYYIDSKQSIMPLILKQNC